MEPDEECVRAARIVLEGYRSFASTIVFYYNDKYSTDRSFVNNLEVKEVIGQHNFCQE
jgi:spore germination cell wall hydrolase CwlJ-like protein